MSSWTEAGPLLELSKEPSLGRMDVGAEKLGGVEGHVSQAGIGKGWKREGEGQVGGGRGDRGNGKPDYGQCAIGTL